MSIKQSLKFYNKIEVLEELYIDDDSQYWRKSKKGDDPGGIVPPGIIIFTHIFISDEEDDDPGFNFIDKNGKESEFLLDDLIHLSKTGLIRSDIK